MREYAMRIVTQAVNELPLDKSFERVELPELMLYSVIRNLDNRPQAFWQSAGKRDQEERDAVAKYINARKTFDQYTAAITRAAKENNVYSGIRQDACNRAVEIKQQIRQIYLAGGKIEDILDLASEGIDLVFNITRVYKGPRHLAEGVHILDDKIADLGKSLGNFNNDLMHKRIGI